YDEVVRELVEQLLDFKIGSKTRELRGRSGTDTKSENGIADIETYTTNAQDAARKLIARAKRSVPALAQLFKINYAKPDKGTEGQQAVQVTYYSAWVLAHI